MTNRDSKGRWLKGQSGNPAGGIGKQSRIPQEVLTLIQDSTAQAISSIVGLLNKSRSDHVRLEAAKFLIEKGLGRNFQAYDQTSLDQLRITIVSAADELYYDEGE